MLKQQSERCNSTMDNIIDFSIISVTASSPLWLSQFYDVYQAILMVSIAAIVILRVVALYRKTFKDD